MLKIILLATLILQCLPAYAELSTNPWLDSNDEEDVQKVYERRSRRGKGDSALEEYQEEQSTVIDRTHAYIQDDSALMQEEEESGFFGKVKSLVSDKPKEDDKLILNTADNRRKLAEKKQQEAAKKQAQKEDNGILSSFGLGGLTNSFKLPNVNAAGMIRKFEKASGINLKAIGKQLK